MNNVIHSK